MKEQINFEMDNSIIDMFSTSNLFDSSNVTITDEFDRLKTIFEDVLYTVALEDIEKQLFEDEIPKLKQACVETLNEIKQHLTKIQNNSQLLEEVRVLMQRYILLLNFATNAVKYINTTVNFQNVLSLPLAIEEILLMTYKHCKESDNLYGSYFRPLSDILKYLFNKASELQYCFLNLVNEIIIFDSYNENDSLCLVKMLESFPEIGELVSSLDIKTAADFWKNYLFISQKYNSLVKTKVCIQRPVKFLCSDVLENLEIVNQMVDIKNSQKAFKISNFNLKILIKLFSFYEYLGDSTGDIFNLLITLNTYSVPYLKYQKRNSNFIDNIQSYIVAATQPLLYSLIDNREFITYYFQNITSCFEDENKRIGAAFLSVLIIKCVLTAEEDVQREWVSNNTSSNIIIATFSSLQYLHVELSIEIPIQIQSLDEEKPTRVASLYEHIFVHLSAAIINVNFIDLKAIQKLLFQAIIQTDSWKAMMATDIWCIIASFGNSDFCYEQVLFLINCFIILQDCRRLQIRYFSNLLSRLYRSLLSKYQTDIVNQYPYDQFIKLWIAIGLKNNPLLVNKIDFIISDAINKIDSFIKCFNAESFEIMCDYLHLLTTYSFDKLNNPPDESLLNRIVKLWLLNIDSEIQEQIWLLRFVKVLSELTASLMKYFNNEDLLKILESLFELNNNNIQIMLSKCVILRSLAVKQIHKSSEHQKIFDAISSQFNILLKDRNPLVEQRVLETFCYFAQRTQHAHILANIVDDESKIEEISNFLEKNVIVVHKDQLEYLKAQSRVTLTHKCFEKVEYSEPQQKKKKLCTDIIISPIIQRLKTDCDSLIENCGSDSLSEDILIDLSVIISKLQNLVKK